MGTYHWTAILEALFYDLGVLNWKGWWLSIWIDMKYCWTPTFSFWYFSLHWAGKDSKVPWKNQQFAVEKSPRVDQFLRSSRFFPHLFVCFPGRLVAGGSPPSFWLRIPTPNPGWISRTAIKHGSWTEIELFPHQVRVSRCLSIWSELRVAKKLRFLLLLLVLVFVLLWQIEWQNRMLDRCQMGCQNMYIYIFVYAIYDAMSETMTMTKCPGGDHSK